MRFHIGLYVVQSFAAVGYKFRSTLHIGGQSIDVCRLVATQAGEYLLNLGRSLGVCHLLLCHRLLLFCCYLLYFGLECAVREFNLNLLATLYPLGMRHSLTPETHYGKASAEDLLRVVSLDQLHGES